MTDRNIKRLNGETYTDYFVRLFSKKDEYELNCDEIAHLLNMENGKNYGESAYRKEWRAFQRGMQYSALKQDENISNRILCISDLHIPFNKPVETFSKYKGCVDTIVLNGDISDNWQISKFNKAYRINPMDEIIQTRKYICDLLNLIKPKKLVVIYGNHDLRFSTYIQNHIDCELSDMMPTSSLELILEDGFYYRDKSDGTKTHFEPLKSVFDGIYEIEYVNNWYTQIGDALFVHPLAYSSAIMKTSEKAITFFRNEGMIFKTLVMAHTHRIGQYTIGNTTAYEQGCCCDTNKMNYTNGRFVMSQREGYLFLCQDADGNTLYNKTVQEKLN